MSNKVEEAGPLQLDETLVYEFEQRFGGTPTHAVWSPGRVNLIGEHTDYNLLPVLPMAVSHGLTIAMRPNDLGRVRLANVNNRFEFLDFEATDDIPKSPAGNWGNYAKAPVQYMASRIRNVMGECRGFDAVVSSSLPSAAGLSSSSALVVGVYTCLAAANDYQAEPLEIAEQMRQSERYVGTASGGMDQATIVLGRNGRALKIGFGPLQVREIRVPDSVVFFAVDSLERAEKSGRARYHYNRRVFECHAAARLIVDTLPDCKAAGMEYPSLADVYRECDLRGIPHMAALLEACGTEPMSMATLNQRIGGHIDLLLRQALLPAGDDEMWDTFPPFLPYQRAAHVLDETDRVERCAAAFDGGDLDAAVKEMEASHASCRDLYHISTPGLERLVAAAKACGARTARVTGAGFGGSIVAMVDADSADKFRERLWTKHYQTHLSEKAASVSAETAILECRPSRGAFAQLL